MITIAGRSLIRRRKPRVLLVPNHWSGSVQEYYHFILGYLGPILLWLDKHPGKAFAIRDCGPMQPWIDCMLGHEDMVVMNPGGMLHMVAGKVHRTAILKGLDDPQRFNAGKLRAYRRLALASADVEDIAEPQALTVIDRATAGVFNASADAEVPESGAAVRSTPNLREAVAVFDDAVIIDAAHVAPRDQLVQFVHTRVLVGQHGAGLANMLWMPAGGTVVEILPPMQPWVMPIFANLAAALGHRHIAVPQDGPHSPVDVDTVRTAIASARQ